MAGRPSASSVNSLPRTHAPLPTEMSASAISPVRGPARDKSARVVHMTSVHSALDPRIFHKECRSLARAGFHVTVIGPYCNNTITDHVHVHPVARAHSRLARMTRTVWRIYTEARRQTADIFHFHDPELIPAGLLLLAAGKKVIYDIHEDLPKDIMSKFYLPAWSRSAIA